MRLEHKVCVITGAGSGIGRAAALLFAREGGKVVVADIDAAGAEETATTIAKNGGQARAVQVDVSQSASVQRMFRATLDAYGRLDVLVNNAGYGFPATVVDTDEDAWDRLMAVNLRGVFLGCKYGIPIMRAQGGGVIVNTASVVSAVGVTNRAAYCASKGGVAALTRAMALDHVRDGIRVNAVAPGTIDSPYLQNNLFAKAADPAALKRQLEQRHPMDRLGTPDEIAYAMLYLASDESSYTTGSLLFADGGMSAW